MKTRDFIQLTDRTEDTFEINFPEGAKIPANLKLIDKMEVNGEDWYIWKVMR